MSETISQPRAVAWPVALFTLALAATCGGLLTHPGAWPLYLPAGDLGTTYWNHWWFEFGALGHGRYPLRCDWLFHPVGCGLTFHTLGLLYCAVFWPARAVAGAAAAYSLEIATTYLLTMLFTYGLARQLGLSRHAAALAGLGAALGRYRFTFAFQLNVLSTQWIALYFWMLIRLLGPVSRRRDAVWLGLSVACLLLTDWYYLLFCATLTPLFVCAAWRSRPAAPQRRADIPVRREGTEYAGAAEEMRKRGGKRKGGEVGMAADAMAGWKSRPPLPWRRMGLAALVAAPVLAFYAVNAAVESRVYPADLTPSDQQRVANSAALADYALSPRLAAFASGDEYRPPLLGMDGRHAERLFFPPGYLLGALALAAAFLRSVTKSSENAKGANSSLRPVRSSWQFGPRFWLIVAACAAVLSLGPELILLKQSATASVATGIPLPYTLLQRLPLFGNISQLYRWGYVATLALSLAGAFAVEPALGWLGRRLAWAPRWLPQLALAAAVFGECYQGSYPWHDGPPSAYAQFLRTQPGDFAILVLPDENVYHLGRYMFDQTIHEKRLMGGYISRPNRRFAAFIEDFAPAQRLRAAVTGAMPALSAAERRELLSAAARHGLRAVVLRLDLDSPRYRTRAARDWLVAQDLAAVAFEDEETCVLFLRE